MHDAAPRHDRKPYRHPSSNLRSTRGVLFLAQSTESSPKVNTTAAGSTKKTVRSSEPLQPPQAKSASTPDRWHELFQNQAVKPETIRTLVGELSAAKKYEDVISLIEQALIQGKGQPWMYEVLALTMEIAGRPRSQIERVLLSSRDLTPPDAESLVFVASYLGRFERF